MCSNTADEVIRTPHVHWQEAYVQKQFSEKCIILYEIILLLQYFSSVSYISRNKQYINFWKSQLIAQLFI